MLITFLLIPSHSTLSKMRTNKKNYYKKGKHVCLNGIIKMIRLIHFICWQKGKADIKVWHWNGKKATTLDAVDCWHFSLHAILYLSLTIFSLPISCLLTIPIMSRNHHQQCLPWNTQKRSKREYTPCGFVFSFFVKEELECFTFMKH